MRGRDEKQMEGGGKSWRRAGKTMMGEGEMGKGGGDWGEEREMEEEKGGKYREKEQEKQGREIFSCLFPSPSPLPPFFSFFPLCLPVLISLLSPACHLLIPFHFLCLCYLFIFCLSVCPFSRSLHKLSLGVSYFFLVCLWLSVCVCVCVWRGWGEQT